VSLGHDSTCTDVSSVNVEVVLEVLSVEFFDVKIAPGHVDTVSVYAMRCVWEMLAIESQKIVEIYRRVMGTPVDSAKYCVSTCSVQPRISWDEALRNHRTIG
jgi:hypothetical protein